MWSNDLRSIVFTRLKVLGLQQLQTKYPNINFTTSARTPTTAKFPTVLIRKLQGSEIMSDIEGTTVNGVLTTFQIDVVDNSSQYNADYIADVICKLMKNMRFQVVGEPYIDESDTATYRNVARYRRVIGASDFI